MEIIGTQKKATEIRLPITTLDRLLATPDVRKRIGSEVKNQAIFCIAAGRADEPSRIKILDLAQKTSVSDSS